ncbi:MAG: hypothetical protein DSM106950_00050 [Stigonema ocellatum SAG 48.90 = DSM 106950]|nr:hypothetical protein [Stigonema ocellatum SAG 48.90 = DSM 106950]
MYQIFLQKTRSLPLKERSRLYFAFDCTGCSVNDPKLLLWILGLTVEQNRLLSP